MRIRPTLPHRVLLNLAVASLSIKALGVVGGSDVDSSPI
jgi:hypothetical protein